jgi:hypothetical protein
VVLSGSEDVMRLAQYRFVRRSLVQYNSVLYSVLYSALYSNFIVSTSVALETRLYDNISYGIVGGGNLMDR